MSTIFLNGESLVICILQNSDFYFDKAFLGLNLSFRKCRAIIYHWIVILSFDICFVKINSVIILPPISYLIFFATGLQARSAHRYKGCYHQQQGTTAYEIDVQRPQLIF